MSMDDLAPPRRLGRDAPDRSYGFAPSPVSITILRKHERQAARPPSSFLSPLATILSELSGSGLCSLSASSAGGFIQTLISSRASPPHRSKPRGEASAPGAHPLPVSLSRRVSFPQSHRHQQSYKSRMEHVGKPV